MEDLLSKMINSITFIPNPTLNSLKAEHIKLNREKLDINYKLKKEYNEQNKMLSKERMGNIDS
jgi:hypothetical protein